MCHIESKNHEGELDANATSATVTPRLELYCGLLPFTILSLFLYYRVLRKIYISRKILAYSSFFYKMTWSLAIYDISYVIMYFIVEIPQGWPELKDFYHSLNDTIFPQLHWAHQWACYLAEEIRKGYNEMTNIQFSGVTLMSISRMLALCYPDRNLSRVMESLSAIKIILLHGIVPLLYGLFVFFFQPPRHYDYNPCAGSITRLGDEYSIKFNSNVTIVTSSGGALISALCYFRIFLVLRKRPYRSWKQEVSVIISSFVLFLSLCAMCAYYVVYKYSLIANNCNIFFKLRHFTFVVTFFIALVNPWCLMITNADIRSAVFGRLFRSKPPQIYSMSTESPVPQATTVHANAFQGTASVLPVPTRNNIAIVI